MNLDTRPNIDWDSLGFNVTETKSMFHSTCIAGEKWSGGELIPYGDISMSPFAGVLNYGQGVFEGIKAFRSPKGHVGLFGADMNGKRMAFSSDANSWKKNNGTYKFIDSCHFNCFIFFIDLNFFTRTKIIYFNIF